MKSPSAPFSGRNSRSGHDVSDDGAADDAPEREGGHGRQGEVALAEISGQAIPSSALLGRRALVWMKMRWPIAGR